MAPKNTKPYSKQRPKSSTEPEDERLLKAITRLWLKTKHTADQEAQREAIFSLWLTDLSNWPVRQTEAVLNRIADSEAWWPAFSMVADALPSPTNAISYDSRLAVAEHHLRRLLDQARTIRRRQYALVPSRIFPPVRSGHTFSPASNACGFDARPWALGLSGGPFWSGEQCLQRLDARQRERAA
ncbi:MAG: hypothetical protein ACRBM6_08730 [Geminicoccales bacterium]